LVYGLVNECDKSTTHTHIGCTESTNILFRIKQHNGIITGGPSETKRADGYWKLMFYLIIPPYRNYSSSEIKLEGRNRRGWQSKCKKTLEIAIERGTIQLFLILCIILHIKGLEFRISEEAFDEKSKYFAKDITNLISNYATKCGKETSDFFIENSFSTEVEIQKGKKTVMK
jgi:hypothetical protein